MGGQCIVAPITPASTTERYALLTATTVGIVGGVARGEMRETRQSANDSQVRAAFLCTASDPARSGRPER